MHEETFDVVVVGGGGAGLAAAIEAAGTGRSVVLLEKSSELHGSTAWSVGSITSSGTPHQEKKGIADRAEDHWRDMALFNGALDARDNPALRRVLAENIPQTFRWLLSHGIRFYGPMPEPPHAVPRMHCVLPNSRSFITHLSRAARRVGVEIRLNTRVLSLHEKRVETQVARFRARGGVVLATGDFTNDPELKGRYMGPREAKIGGVNTGATGDGQKLALALGARVINGDLALGPELRFIAPRRRNPLLELPPWPALASFMAWSLEHMPGALLRPFIMSFVTTSLAPSPALFEAGAILVNRRGERFTDERHEPAYALPDQPDKVAFILLDGRIARQFSAWPHFISTAPGVAYAYLDDYRRNRPDVFTSASSLELLAENLGMRLKNLPLGGGPYIALGPVQAVFVHNEGGLAVDAEHRVLGTDGKPIAGLYAAGSCGQGGLLLKGHGHHLAWAFVSGRRAGRHAALATQQLS